MIGYQSFFSVLLASKFKYRTQTKEREGETVDHTVTYNKDLGYILTTFQGELDKSMVTEIINKALDLCAEHNCNLILSDYRNVKLELSTLNIYDVPNIILKEASKRDIAIHRVKRSMILKQESSDLQFFENVSFNRGQNVRIFYDFEEAQSWLLE